MPSTFTAICCREGERLPKSLCFRSHRCNPPTRQRTFPPLIEVCCFTCKNEKINLEQGVSTPVLHDPCDSGSYGRSVGRSVGSIGTIGTIGTIGAISAIGIIATIGTQHTKLQYVHSGRSLKYGRCKTRYLSFVAHSLF